MPESRKRPGHHPHKGTPDIPPSQRVKGRVIWSILLAVFAFLMAYFGGVSTRWIVIAVAAGAVLGYAIGRRMEKDV